MEGELSSTIVPVFRREGNITSLELGGEKMEVRTHLWQDVEVHDSAQAAEHCDVVLEVAQDVLPVFSMQLQRVQRVGCCVHAQDGDLFMRLFMGTQN